MSVTCEHPGIWNFKKLYDCFAAREERAKPQLPSDARSLSRQLPFYKHLLAGREQSLPEVADGAHRKSRTEPNGSCGRSPPESPVRSHGVSFLRRARRCVPRLGPQSTPNFLSGRCPSASGLPDAGFPASSPGDAACRRSGISPAWTTEAGRAAAGTRPRATRISGGAAAGTEPGGR